jgi:hypothetical protein
LEKNSQKRKKMPMDEKREFWGIWMDKTKWGRRAGELLNKTRQKRGSR